MWPGRVPPTIEFQHLITSSKSVSVSTAFKATASRDSPSSKESLLKSIFEDALCKISECDDQYDDQYDG